jgi:flagellar hook protein FlgE
MMSQAFYTGLSGLQTSQVSIDVIADNLANTSTIGYRGYTAEFSNMFESMINTSAESSSVNSSVGTGVVLSGTKMDESQGVFQLTPSSTDLAILGDGWFGVEAYGETSYTKNGSFTFDANRDLVTQEGYFVLGTMGTNITDGVLTEQLASVPLGDVENQEKLQFPQELYFPAVATTEATFGGNLSLNDDISTISTGVINSEGVKNNLRLEFTKSAVQVAPGVQWDVVATTENLDGSVVYSTETGTVSFDENGALTSNTLSSIDNQGTAVNIDLGTGYDGLISINAVASASSSANGLEDGDLLGYDISANGEIVATFTNGVQSSIGSVAVYHFANDAGLERLSGSIFGESNNSGDPIFMQDADGNNIIGTDLTNFKLEGSNVKMEAGLTDLIIMQRSYDANSKSITAADEMLQKALNMSA